MKQIKTINPRNVLPEEIETYNLRNAARAVVIDQDNLVALLHVSRDGYYKLPGGGVEEGEDLLVALGRECLEEIGCDIEVVDEIGSTLEIWKEDREKQISNCYFAKVVGQKGEPNFTESEKDRKFGVLWVSYDEALKLMEESTPVQFEGEYIKPRDIAFMKEAKKYFKPL